MYRVCDNGMPVLCDSAWVRLNILDVNDGPDALDDTASVNEDDSVTINVRLNDSDVDGTLNNPVVITNPTHGTVTVDANGNVKYIPNPNYHGLDSFMYRVCDNGTPVLCDSAWVRINVLDVNDKPDAINDTASTNQNVAVVINVLTNDTDTDGTLNNPTVITQPLNGTAVVNANGTVTYTPNANYFGVDSFMYRVCDNGTPTMCDSAWVNVTVKNVISNLAPIAVDDTIQVNENDKVVFNVTTNDYDQDGNKLGLPVVIKAPLHGTLLLRADTTFIYIPNTGYIGNDQFTYTIADNGIPSKLDTAVVYIEVVPLVVKVPDGFSPDGDGTNDKFVIPGIEKYPNNKLTIVNRWGDVVYEKSQYQNDWGGEPNKGILLDKGVLPAGNYFYIFETGTTDKSITGSLYINK
jgi:gliding motility-associated-like protein